MPRNVSDEFKAALTANPVRPIELVSITYKDSSLLNRTKQFAIWPSQVVLGRLIFQPRPYIWLDAYEIGLANFPTTAVTFLTSQYKQDFADAYSIHLGYPDLRGAQVKVWRVLADHLESEDDTIADTFTVGTPSYGDEHVTLDCDTVLQNPARTFPPNTYTRQTCQWTFKDPLTCKWISGQGGDASFCSKVMDGDSGCKAHKNTKNFGAYPSIADEAINTSGA